MRNALTGSLVGLAAAILLSGIAPSARAQGGYQNTEFDKLKSGPGGPAPKRDLTGTWLGPISAKKADDPQLTAAGQKLFSLNKSEAKFHVADTNDPFVRTCDPMGFPRNVVFETRGLSFANMPDRIIMLSQYQKVWREIWTDGRALPTNVGAAEKGAPDPRYYGYSVGHWENDNTFVIDSTGLDDRTWLNGDGYPHSVNAKVQERYTRVDHNDITLSVTVDDPANYSKPFVLGTSNFKWSPSQQLEEQLCIPSEMLQYLSVIGDPAGNGVPATK